ncbi:MAG TPA: type IV pilin protein [Pseudomonadales bacterium]|nr:type IV pilin protein [Pseudomonadales bacterium]
MKRNQIGMTLLELMIVVAIIGILAGIAYPSYQNSVLKSRRAEAHTDLFALQLAMEKARGNCATYASGFGTGGCTSSQVNYTANSSYYTLSISGASGSDYTLTATATGAQASDTDCATITLTRDGTQGGTTANCW